MQTEVRERVKVGLFVVALAATVVAGCSSGDGNGDAKAATTTTTERPTTTTTVEPSEAFLDDMTEELEFGEADGPQAMLDLAQATCDALDAIDDMVGADAPNDNASTDAAIGATSESLAIATAFRGDGLDDQVVAVVLTNGGEHLCPQHAGAIEDYLEREGIELP